MITTKEYLDALEVVNKYHEQLALEVDRYRLKIEALLIHCESTRLNSVLRHAIKRGKVYVDEISTKKLFFRLYLGGNRSWKDFQDLLSRYNGKHTINDN